MLQSSEAPTSAATGGEIVLFGVRVKVDPMRKSVSMNNLSEYEPVAIDGSKNNETPKAEAEDGAAGYASADDAVPQPSGGSRERKRGVPWTEEEHKLFLLGLQKVGKGDWRGISRNYVKTRTPTQVASHAQKYFLRRSNINRRRRRSSLFDITTDSVSTMPVEEAKNHEESPVQPPSSGNGFSVVPFPMTMTPPVMFSMHQNSSMAQTDNSSPFLIRPVSPLPCSSTVMDLSLRQQSSPLSLRLSLSSGQDQPSISIRASDSQRMSGFNNGNGDGIITVA